MKVPTRKYDFSNVDLDSLFVAPPTAAECAADDTERIAAKGHDCFANIKMGRGERVTCMVCKDVLQF